MKFKFSLEISKIEKEGGPEYPVLKLSSPRAVDDLAGLCLSIISKLASLIKYDATREYKAFKKLFKN